MVLLLRLLRGGAVRVAPLLAPVLLLLLLLSLKLLLLLVRKEEAGTLHAGLQGTLSVLLCDRQRAVKKVLLLLFTLYGNGGGGVGVCARYP